MRTLILWNIVEVFKDYSEKFFGGKFVTNPFVEIPKPPPFGDLN